MHLMLGQKSARVYAAVATFCALIVGSTCGNAEAQGTNDDSEAYVPLPDNVRDELIKLGVEDPFIIYAVDFSGDLVGLVPSDVTVAPVAFPLETEVLKNASGVTIIRLEASESTLTCRWPPKSGDPPCSKQTKN